MRDSARIREFLLLLFCLSAFVELAQIRLRSPAPGKIGAAYAGPPPTGAHDCAGGQRDTDRGTDTYTVGEDRLPQWLADGLLPAFQRWTMTTTAATRRRRHADFSGNKSDANSTRPAQIWPYACVPDPNCSEPSREGRASVCNRAVERRFRAISADWRFWLWGGKTAISRNGDIEPLPNR